MSLPRQSILEKLGTEQLAQVFSTAAQVQRARMDFQKAVQFTPPITQRDIISGHDLRCAILLVMDQHKIETRNISLTGDEISDLFSCLSYKIGNTDFYNDVRLLTIDRLQISSPGTSPK